MTEHQEKSALKKRRSVAEMLRKAAQKMGCQNFRIFSVIMISALIIFSARLLAPVEVSKDQSAQMEAVFRLVQGLGLTHTDVEQQSYNLTEPPPAEYITWFPPTFTLLLAGFLYAGVPLLISLKIIYGSLTLIGWIGWAIIATHLISDPLRLGGRSYPLQYVIAAALPFVLTPLWQGTDIFLWAGVPFIIILLAKGNRPRRALIGIILAGLIFGFLYSVRYASAFLGLAALLILAQANLPNFRAFLKRASVFFLASALFILPTLLYVRQFSSKASVVPEFVNPAENFWRIPDTTKMVIKSLPAASVVLVGSSLVKEVCDLLRSKLISAIVGTSCLLIIFSMPLIHLRNRDHSGEDDVKRPVRWSVSILPACLVSFLVTASLVNAQGLVMISRYYLPIASCGVMFFYWAAGRSQASPRILLVSRTMVLCFALSIPGFLTFTALRADKRRELARTVLSFTPTRSAGSPTASLDIGYPSTKLYSRKENSRLKLKQLHRQNPEALFFIQRLYAFFVYDAFQDGGPVPGKHLRRLPFRDAGFWKRAYTDRELKVFWVFDYPIAGADASVLGLIDKSNLKQVFEDEYEKTLIFESNFPQGYRFAGHGVSVATTESAEAHPDTSEKVKVSSSDSRIRKTASEEEVRKSVTARRH